MIVFLSIFFNVNVKLLWDKEAGKQVGLTVLRLFGYDKHAFMKATNKGWGLITVLLYSGWN